MLEQGGPSSWWWSATAASDIKTNALGISSGVDGQYNAHKTNGWALRSTIARRYPLSYVLSGFYIWGYGGVYNQGSGGYWMSNTAPGNVYLLRITNSGENNPQGSNAKTDGAALRRQRERPPSLP